MGIVEEERHMCPRVCPQLLPPSSDLTITNIHNMITELGLLPHGLVVLLWVFLSPCLKKKLKFPSMFENYFTVLHIGFHMMFFFSF